MSFVKEDYYAHAYKIYLRLSGQREANIRCLQEHIPKALQELQLPQHRPKLNVLSIGAGDGYMDQEIVKIVKEGYLNKDKQFEDVKILNTAVEPHSGMVEQYKTSIEGRHEGEWSIKFDLKPMSFEKYAESKHDPNQYDMVHAIHSLYFVENMDATLKHLYHNELREKGIIACLIADRECIFFEITSLSKKSPIRNRRSLNDAGDIVAIAQENKWKFDKFPSPFSIDVTGILRDNSDEGNVLIDWLTFIPAFYQSADQELIDGVLELLKNQSTEDDVGRLVIKATNELIVIYKS